MSLLDGSIPALTNVRGATFPRIHADGRATFRLQAPRSRTVRLILAGGVRDCGDGPFAMERSDSGYWQVTVAPSSPGFHYYWFEADGVAVNDAGSETFFGHGRLCSGIEIPEPPEQAAYYMPQHVPHGEVRQRWYHAQSTGEWRTAFVYAPPGYDDALLTRYPVLYLQHGSGEDARGWCSQGRMCHIMDNLIASGRCAPMLVVMESGQILPRPSSSPAALFAAFEENALAFGRLMIQDLIPTIDQTYRTLANHEHRALAGLSMGGLQTLTVGLGNLDTFAWLGVFSGSPIVPADIRCDYGGALADPVSFHEHVRLLWLSAGTAEPAGMERMRIFDRLLSKAGIAHETYTSEGTGHEWLTWRRSLFHFAPLLFR